MTDFTTVIGTPSPTYDEVEAIIKEGRQLRARAMRDGAIRLWSMLPRVVTVRPTPAKARLV